jgi:hypothetical protein
MADGGADAFALAEIFGWSDVRMALRYTHATDEAKRRAVENLVREKGPSDESVTNEKGCSIYETKITQLAIEQFILFLHCYNSLLKHSDTFFEPCDLSIFGEVAFVRSVRLGCSRLWGYLAERSNLLSSEARGQTWLFQPCGSLAAFIHASFQA